MLKNNLKIACTAGIYDTCYTLINHRDGTISVKIPRVEWIKSQGVLKFATMRIKDFKKIMRVLYFFEYDTLVDNRQTLLDEVLCA